MAFEHILVVGGGREKEGEAGAGVAVCSFKPPFEDDARRSHVSCARIRGLRLFVYSFVHRVGVRVCGGFGCARPICLCVCVCL